MNVITNPHMLPKVKCQTILDIIGGKDRRGVYIRPFACSLRISGLIPGHRCAPPDTVVACHVGNLGKGMSTKVSDLNVAAGCANCHDLIDRKDSRWQYLAENYPTVIPDAMLSGMQETLAQLVWLGLVVIPDGEIIH